VKIQDIPKNYIFGPVRSRRLGFSLGVDVIPYKICSLDCPYCQLGRTTVKTIERSPYGDADAIIAELSQVLREKQKIDYITLSGSGEPTLSSNLGAIIRRIKEITQIPVAVLTNGTLLYREGVREELSAADLVVPSLDAVSEDMFQLVNRPHPLVTVPHMLSGLEQFRNMFGGQLWLEIMLLKGVNDSAEEIEKIKKAIAPIAFDRVQLNTPVRPAWDSSITPLSSAELDGIRERIGAPCEVIAGTRQKQLGVASALEERIVRVIQRRPLNLVDIADALGMPPAKVSKHLAHLEAQGRVTTRRYGSELFYQMTR
jgi:wyosine [tRNA(Phe)-imidazoG37] synthetase (radical SAM superfamily)